VSSGILKVSRMDGSPQGGGNSATRSQTPPGHEAAQNPACQGRGLRGRAFISFLLAL
jgi:hypothetical protein